MASIIEVYLYHDRDIVLMTDEEENRDTHLWPSRPNIVEFLSIEVAPPCTDSSL
jgi:hypothetical protein